MTWRLLDGEVVLLDVGGARYHSLNRTASVMWPKLEAGATTDELVEAVVDEFDAEHEVVRRDVEAFLERCRQQKWIE